MKMYAPVVRSSVLCVYAYTVGCSAIVVLL